MKREKSWTLVSLALTFAIPSAADTEERCQELGVEISEAMEDYEVTQQVFEKLIEEKTFDPCYVTHVPKELVPLAKQNSDDDSLVDVYELIINGQEISPGYSELNEIHQKCSKIPVS